MESLIFHSRKEKEIFLKEIIQKLSITQPEKDIYFICIEILEEDAFENFFIKIMNQIPWNTENKNSHELLNLISL